MKSRERKGPRKPIVRTLFQKFYVPILFNKKTEMIVYFISILLLGLGVTG